MKHQQAEGSGCSCGSPEAHQRLVEGVIASGLKDPERAQLALHVATSQALIRRARAHTNGA